jgi:HlyD family secretion protein
MNFAKQCQSGIDPRQLCGRRCCGLMTRARAPDCDASGHRPTKGYPMSGLLCGIPVIAGFFASCAAPAPFATGYVEGEFLLIAPVATTQVETLDVRRGDRVEAGQTLAAMEHRDAEIALAEAVSALAEVNSRLADLRESQRDEEINVIEASLASARAQQRGVERELVRLRQLLERRTAPQSQVDDAQTAVDVAQARVAEMEANLAVARLPARPHAIAAAEAAVARAQAGRDAAAWQLGKRTLTAPATGTIFEIFRRQGEIAGPQAPVLSLLPDGAVLLRLYVPEPQISGIEPGSRLAVNCDGCPPRTSATVTFVSDTPEFTPPVIYSLENRQKLVYLVEARPDPGADVLQPGQIVDVRLGDAP